MTTHILDPSALLSNIPSLLPEDGKTLKSAQDGIAALLHGALVALAFRLTGVEESSTSNSAISNNILPASWNAHGPGHYTFNYRHDQSSLNFVIKVSKLGSRTVINAIAVESDKVASLDVSTDDFTSSSFYPKTIESSGTPPLVHGFISSNRVSDLISQFKLKIITKLVPGLQKEGYTEQSTEPVSASGSRPSQPTLRAPNPRPDAPPDAPERNAYQPPLQPRNPLEIGRRDLDPFPANPFSPPSLFGGRGDGMFVGPEHPIFGGERGINPPGRGPFGGDGFLPPMGAPPGARFDPIAPGIGPFGPRRGGRFPGAMDPDNDEFMPPGMHDSFS
ncbi:PI31 proteasome regulator N-terminal-domain-containing protein [Crepidotus variabilis]|uniref:PI31 proteasome regulator N-terminal-domain-containing protein n=1 Tax=Crepidotus variabilis TaxID=179855 RepID=A0A9P6ET56_9AGAR|nr:PI31 proteasome regulator N-terminal-domain-containing protein [Crepidotus variabilis]